MSFGSKIALWMVGMLTIIGLGFVAQSDGARMCIAMVAICLALAPFVLVALNKEVKT